MQYQLREVKQLEATSFAFAALRGDGGVVTWGDPQCGGDSTAVREMLNAQVRQLHATSHAFAAIKDDGTVVTWGSAANGGDSTTIQPILKDVQEIQSTHCAFAALQTDGHVIAWGDTRFGGDYAQVQDQLRDVYQIHASGYAFAALRIDGRCTVQFFLRLFEIEGSSHKPLATCSNGKQLELHGGAKVSLRGAHGPLEVTALLWRSSLLV